MASMMPVVSAAFSPSSTSAAGDLLQPLARQLQFLEQNVAQLLRRVDIERLPGDLVDRLLALEQGRGQVLRHMTKELDVNAHTDALHVGDHRQQFHLQVHKLRQPLLLQFVL